MTMMIMKYYKPHWVDGYHEYNPKLAHSRILI